MSLLTPPEAKYRQPSRAAYRYRVQGIAANDIRTVLTEALERFPELEDVSRDSMGEDGIEPVVEFVTEVILAAPAYLIFNFSLGASVSGKLLVSSIRQKTYVS